MATSLTKFARNERKEETTVITARLPNSRHERLKNYCDDLGLSINEAINLLIEVELKNLEKEEQELEEEELDEEPEEELDEEPEEELDEEPEEELDEEPEEELDEEPEEELEEEEGEEELEGEPEEEEEEPKGEKKERLFAEYKIYDDLSKVPVNVETVRSAFNISKKTTQRLKKYASERRLPLQTLVELAVINLLEQYDAK